MAKLGKVIAGLGAVAGGYMQGSEMYRRREREEREDAERQEDRTRRRAAEDRETNDRIELANALKPVAVETPNDVMGDDEGNAMPSVPAFRAGGQRFDTMAQAQTAANAANTPEAVQARLASANVSDPTKVLTLQNAVLAQGNAQRESRNAAFRDALGEAMAGGHEGLAGFATKFEHGPFKGKKAQLTVSPDGKTATYNVLQDDGTLKPVFTTTNDENGIREAGFRFDRLVTPQQRAEFAMKLSKEQREVADEERKGRKTDSDIALNDARIDYTKKLGQAAVARSERAGSGAPAQTAPVWSDKADGLLSKVYFATDAEGRPAIDANGAQFAKAIALGVAQMNGGDSYSGAMHAIEVDQRLKAAAEQRAPQAKDPAAHAATLKQLRAEYLNRVRNPQPAKPPATLSPVARSSAAGAPGSITLDPTGAPGRPITAPTLGDARGSRDPLAGRVIGRLTPMADIEASAAAGNPEAIAYLERRQRAELDNLTAPASAADMLIR